MTLTQDIFNMRKLFQVTETEEIALNWCRDRGLFPREMECPLCGDMLPVRSGARFGLFLCQKKIAGHEIYGKFKMTAANNTFFSNTKIPLPRVLLLIYAFSRKFTYELTKIELARPNAPHVSENTIADWFSYLREVCRDALERRYSNQPLIGGANHMVEIDECKIGHRKLEQGHLVEGKWVLGMVDRDTKEVRLEICPNNKKDAEILLRLIKKHVAPKTVIVTDVWREYDDLDQCKFQHLIENHGLRFISPQTGATTKTIEGNWRSLKKRLSRGGIRHDDMSLHLCEYLWRRDCERLNIDCFSRIVEDIQVLCPGGIE